MDEIRSSFSTLSQSGLRPTQSMDPAAEKAMSSFASMFSDTIKEGERTSASAISGQEDPHNLLVSLSNAEFMVNTVVTVRDRAVQAYQEIFRMPI
ncbi:MAG: flagellar hook-basal body complex protein FliE [Pseudomonadota bacterium]